MVKKADPRRGSKSAQITQTAARIWAFFISFTVTCLVPGPIFACAFDMIKPDRTQIDWIVEAETLVLARPTANNPFSYETLSVLHGNGERPPINQLVDSATRRTLALNQRDSVLFAYQPDSGWQRVALVNDGFRDILDTALAHRASWNTGMPQSRMEFVSALQDSPVPVHKAIVIGELDKVPYADLRQLDLRIPSEDLLADLWTQRGYPYQAIRALLLGLSDDPSARKEIHDYINRAADSQWSNNLGAFAAAFIELEGKDGVDHLDRTMLRDPDQPLDRVEQIVMALSVHHGLSDTNVNAAIKGVVQDLVERRPETGAIVARQFSLRSDWSQAMILEPLVQQRKVALTDLVTISVYVARARENDASRTEVAGD